MKRPKKFVRREPNTAIPSGRGRALDIGGQLDVARCPLCEGPMTPRLNRQGSYFHCYCHARREAAPSCVRQPAAVTTEERRSGNQARVLTLSEATIENKLLVSCDSPPALRFPSCNKNLSSVG